MGGRQGRPEFSRRNGGKKIRVKRDKQTQKTSKNLNVKRGGRVSVEDT